MIRLTLAGPDTTILSSLCAACPFSAAGCCVAPPRLDWSDVGRIVAHGGRDWLLEEIAAERLTVGERWLVVTRRKRVMAAGAGPRLTACVYLGDTGCTIAHERRSATCNYYVCDDALKEGGADGARARAAHDELVGKFVAWDAEIAERVATCWPEGPAIDAPFLDWLGATVAELTATA
jgi:hypothetical protein